MKKLIIILAAALCAVSLAAQPKLTADNIDEILAAMTLEEKATFLVGGGWGSMTAGALTASNETLVSGAAGTTRASPRLGIPTTVLADGPAGLRINPTRPGTDRTFYCTGFPVGTVLASTFKQFRFTSADSSPNTGTMMLCQLPKAHCSGPATSPFLLESGPCIWATSAFQVAILNSYICPC